MLSKEKQEDLKSTTASLKELYARIDQYYVKKTSFLSNVILLECLEEN